jgi:hypothetical protein
VCGQQDAGRSQGLVARGQRIRLCNAMQCNTTHNAINYIGVLALARSGISCQHFTCGGVPSQPTAAVQPPMPSLRPSCVEILPDLEPRVLVFL